MTDQERIVQLEARIAQLEQRVAQVELSRQVYGPVPQFPRPWDGPGVIYGPPYKITC